MKSLAYPDVGEEWTDDSVEHESIPDGYMSQDDPSSVERDPWGMELFCFDEELYPETTATKPTNYDTPTKYHD